ncbi:Solute carrier family 12 member 9 [Papilio xuthus]|uniref:Solute carrier family 12 member 9 n=1 Tax=Papilio xuthus TaxID=66420 RepID=A0A194QJ95_PAPXU|nr:Solute carrier family 12 member 9 [Papilio xuthus]
MEANLESFGALLLQSPVSKCLVRGHKRQLVRLVFTSTLAQCRIFFLTEVTKPVVMADTLDPLSPSINSPRVPGLMHKLRMRFGRSPPPRPPGEGYVEFGEFRTEAPGVKKVGTFAGVFCPVVLSMFSALVFIRMGYLVGNAGLLVTLGQFALAYLIVIFTVTSICAISTNGAVEGGGVYYRDGSSSAHYTSPPRGSEPTLIMISRTLGPEFGGAIGTLFFFANVVSSALCISACTEALVENFGANGYLIGSSGGLPTSWWFSFLYRSVLNALGLAVSLAGASLFARTSLAIWFTVLVCLASAFISFFVTSPGMIEKPDTNELVNTTSFQYTGLSKETLYSNIYPSYGRDYSTTAGDRVDFASVFGVLFTGVTGVMAGANMSGELKQPSRSIPAGTLWALLFTALCYTALTLLSAATCSRELLQNNYVYLLPINVWPPFIAVGMLLATFSAGLSNLIGASRVLEALAKDDIYVEIWSKDGEVEIWSKDGEVEIRSKDGEVEIWSKDGEVEIWSKDGEVEIWSKDGEVEIWSKDGEVEIWSKDGEVEIWSKDGEVEIWSKDGFLLRPMVSRSGNPVVAVLTSWLLVQIGIMAGSLNAIAQVNSVLFITSYFAINLACLGLDLASAPNFRPSFKYFSWVSALLGMAGSAGLVFGLRPTYAAGAALACTALVLALHLLSPAAADPKWGSLSQALIFHQVRKYLLLLDPRREHVKFWRPQMLLLVSSPRHAAPLIDFVNDQKKGGLFVIGHVRVGELDGSGDPLAEEHKYWLKLIDHLKVKAFVELCLARCVREGAAQLTRLAGLGAMKPDTVLLGFRDDHPHTDFFRDPQSPYKTCEFELEGGEQVFPWRGVQTRPSAAEYVRIVRDVLCVGKNVCLCRHFHMLDMAAVERPQSPYKTCEFELEGGEQVFPWRGVQTRPSAAEYVRIVRDVLCVGKNVCLCRHFHMLDMAAVERRSGHLKYIDVWLVEPWRASCEDAFTVRALFALQLAAVVRSARGWQHLRLRVHHAPPTTGKIHPLITDGRDPRPRGRVPAGRAAPASDLRPPPYEAHPYLSLTDGRDPRPRGRVPAGRAALASGLRPPPYEAHPYLSLTVLSSGSPPSICEPTSGPAA